MVPVVAFGEISGTHNLDMTKASKLSPPARLAKTVRLTGRRWQNYLPIGITLALPRLLRADDQVDYRYEYYAEDARRMTIQTDSVYFEQQLSDAFDVNGELVYDGISGATPTGTHDINGKVLTTEVKDIRHAANLSLDGKLGNETITPGFAWSQETDYLSYGVSLNDAIEFNEKNTTVQVGASHNFDSVRHADKKTWSDKESSEGLIGISQLLTPKTILAADFTFGYENGFLSDPYRLAQYHPTIFPPNFFIGVPERRPDFRSKEILYTSLTQYFDRINGSLEGSYRFYNDSYGIVAHTVGLTWHQWLGKHFIVEPQVRLYEQSAASFYSTTFSGPFSSNPAGIHSSDYRLSNLYSVDVGLQATALVCSHFHVVAGYHRYAMYGMDGKTSAAMYPKANVFTIGISILW